METLDEGCLESYRRDGFARLSGLIPAEAAVKAQESMWRCMAVDPYDPRSWAGVPRGHPAYDAPELVAVYTPGVLRAAAALAGSDYESFRPPKKAHAINVFPSSEPWQWPGPHLDHAIKEHGHHTFPYPFRIASMLFLSDIHEHGGGTVVWPGSHLKVEALAKSDPERYDLMWTLNQDLARIDLGPALELTPRCGDVLFYHPFCAHAGSKNVSEHVRLAMNMKW